ncbi:MAG: hypothetical protein Q7T16_06580 [Candidatus Burarchaeum sp.]|nr:hypothetical protein [Candidatus Burarchaeum sp.]MDO8340295.1 hypothetical protein [Candidatus Burarchaeum sp.]
METTTILFYIGLFIGIALFIWLGGYFFGKKGSASAAILSLALLTFFFLGGCGFMAVVLFGAIIYAFLLKD